MWEITYTMTPTRGYFDVGEPALWASEIRIDSIHGIEFVSDGSVAILYVIDGSADALREQLAETGDRFVDYTITNDCDPLVAQIRFFPDETLERIFAIQQSFGVSKQFPIRYVGYDPATIEITEIGPREELRRRIGETREVASVDVKQLHPYEPATDQLFQRLTDRQQEVLIAAIEGGYYRCPKEATQEDIAEELSCSASVVGQHLRRIETKLVSGIVPDGVDSDVSVAGSS